MKLYCSLIPRYDARSCCQACHDNRDDSTIFQVMIERRFLNVCCNAYRYAKKNRMVTATLSHARREDDPRLEQDNDTVS